VKKPSPRPLPIKTLPANYVKSLIIVKYGTAMQISGAIGIAIVDIDSGMTLAQAGGEQLNLLSPEHALAGTKRLSSLSRRDKRASDLNFVHPPLARLIACRRNQAPTETPQSDDTTSNS
jgi:hypothetical protein